MKKIYDALSIVFYPTLLAFVVSIIFSLYSPVGLGSLTAMQSVFIGVMFLAILPTAPILYYLRKGNVDINISLREKRTRFYIVAVVSQSAAVAIFLSAGAAVMLSYSAATLLVTLAALLINLKWKISAHSSGAAVDAAALALVFGFWPVFILVPAVSFVRYKAGAHTVSQLAAGAAVGILVTLLVFAMAYH